MADLPQSACYALEVLSTWYIVSKASLLETDEILVIGFAASDKPR